MISCANIDLLIRVVLESMEQLGCGCDYGSRWSLKKVDWDLVSIVGDADACGGVHRRAHVHGRSHVCERGCCCCIGLRQLQVNSMVYSWMHLRQP